MAEVKEINTKNIKDDLIYIYDNGKKDYLKDGEKLLNFAENVIKENLAIFQSNTAEAWTEAKQSKQDIKDFFIEAVAPNYAEAKNISLESAEKALKHEVGKLYKNLNGSPYYDFNYFIEDLKKTSTDKDYNCPLFSLTANPEPVTFPVSSLSFIAGRPSAGKTTALTSVAMHAVRQGRKVLFITTEETPKQIITRFIKNQFCFNCLQANDLEKIEKGIPTKKINKAFKETILNNLNTTPALSGIDINNNSFSGRVNNATAEIKSFLNKEMLQVFDLSATTSFKDLEEVLIEQDPYTIVLLDYIQNLPHGALTNNNGSETAFRENIRESTQRINNILKNNDLIGIAGAQLNREGGDEINPEPFQLKNMGDSGSLERVAHIVVMLGRKYNPDTETKDFFYSVMKDREEETTGLHFKLISKYYGYSYTEQEKSFNTNMLINMFPKKRKNNEKTNNYNKDTKKENKLNFESISNGIFE